MFTYIADNSKFSQHFQYFKPDPNVLCPEIEKLFSPGLFSPSWIKTIHLSATALLVSQTNFWASSLISTQLLRRANRGARGKAATKMVMKPNWSTEMREVMCWCTLSCFHIWLTHFKIFLEKSLVFHQLVVLLRLTGTDTAQRRLEIIRAAVISASSHKYWFLYRIVLPPPFELWNDYFLSVVYDLLSCKYIFQTVQTIL